MTVTTGAAIMGIAMALVFATPAYAQVGAAGTNADCAVCHKGAAVRNGVPAALFSGSINYTKCKACHWLTSRTRTGYYTHKHQANTACYGCHAGYASGPNYYPNVRTAAGYFATSNYNLTAAELHRIHVRGSWPQSGVPAACASCHAPATCDACHAVPSTHSGHAYNADTKNPLDAPATVLATRGTPNGNADAITAQAQPVSCLSSRCHAVQGDGSTITKPSCESCHVPVATFSVNPVAPVKRPTRTAPRR